MQHFVFKKLVRDNIPNLMKVDDQYPQGVRTLDDDELERLEARRDFERRERERRERERREEKERLERQRQQAAEKKRRAAEYEKKLRARYAMLKSKGIMLPPYEEWKRRLI